MNGGGIDTLAAVNGCMSIAAIGINIPAKNPRKHGFGKTEVCRNNVQLVH